MRRMYTDKQIENIAAQAGGGGNKLYQHNISTYGGASTDLSVQSFSLSIITKDNTPFNFKTLVEYLKNNGFTSSGHMYNTNGFSLSNNKLEIYYACYVRGNDEDITMPYASVYIYDNGSVSVGRGGDASIKEQFVRNFHDTVIEL